MKHGQCIGIGVITHMQLSGRWLWRLAVFASSELTSWDVERLTVERLRKRYL